MASLWLTTPSAHAGTYSVTYSGGTYNYYQTPPAADSFNSYLGTYGPTGNPSNIADAASPPPITANFTWQPASGQTAQTDPPPANVIVAQTCNASYNVTWYNLAGYIPPIGSCSDGLGDAEKDTSTSGTNYVSYGGTSSNTHYQVVPTAGDGSASVSCSPSAHLDRSDGGDWYGSCNLTYTAAATPVTINLGGTLTNSNGQPVLDSSGNQQILIGQQCSATLSGIPAGCTVASNSYSWTVSGSTLAVWGGNNTSSTYLPFLNPSPAASPHWFWSDLGPKPTVETVTCTATVTPPAGQGAAFPITVTQKVTVYVPGWTCTGTAGTMQINTLWPSGNGADSCLWAGPQSGTAGRGITWNATVSAPTGCPALGVRSLEMVQTETPNETYTSTAGTVFNRSNNGQQGLDSSYPYPFSAPSYTSGDSPGFDLTSHSAVSAQLTSSFVDTLMYAPTGGGQYVPIATFKWSTPASSTASVSPAGTTPFTKSNTFPSWSQNVGNGTFTWVAAK